MSEKDILGAFLLVNNPIVLSEEEIKDVQKAIKQLLQENKQLKMIIEEYERLNKENGRGFMITSVKQYNIDELIRCEDNWNKLKEYIDIKLYNTKYLQKLCGCRIDDETHMILDIIKKEMQELEGSDNK